MADSHARTAFTERIMGKSLYTKECWVTVSPLVNLMKDQVDKPANLGILAASLVRSLTKMQRVLWKKKFQSYMEVRKRGIQS